MRRQKSHFRFIAVVVSLFMTMTSGVVSAQAGEVDYIIPGGGDFHPPRSEAERALDSIFKRNDDDGNMTNYLLGVPYRDVKKDKDYAGLFTSALRDAVSKAEAEMIMDGCGGMYDEGGRCGFEFNPIICAQDTPDYYLYRVEQQDKDKVVITLGFSNKPNNNPPYPAATYSVVRRGKNWVMDGILCRNSYGYFNFTDFYAVKGLTTKPQEE